MSMTDAPAPASSAAQARPPAGPAPGASSAEEAMARLAEKLAEAGKALSAAPQSESKPAVANAANPAAKVVSNVAPQALLTAAPAAPPAAPKPPAPPPAPNVARMSAPYAWEGIDDKPASLSLAIPPSSAAAEEPAHKPAAQAVAEPAAAPPPRAASQVLEKVKGGLLRAAEARPPRRWRMIGGAILGVGLIALGAGALLKDRDPSSFAIQPEEFRARMAQRPELAIHTLHVTGRENLSVEDVKTALGIGPDGRASAVGFDATAAKQRLEASPWVRSAAVALSDDGQVYVTLDERQPAAVWQIRGEFWLIDSEGQRISRIMDAGERVDLPWVVGAGANTASGEARRVLEAAGPELRAQIGALTRVGQRRWDLELLDGRRILLPEADPLTAVRRLGDMVRNADLLQRSFLELNYTNAAEGLVASLPEEAEAYRERLRADPLAPKR